MLRASGPEGMNASGPSARHSPDAQNELFGELTEGTSRARAGASFPDTPEFRFAKARRRDYGGDPCRIGNAGVPIEEETGPFGQEITDDYIARLSSAAGDAPVRPVVITSGTLHDREFAIASVPPTDELLRINELRHARTTFEQLTVPGPLQSYAHLCAGIIALRLADRAGALEHFTALERLATDPTLHYDARALAGVVHERQQEWDQAITSYRSALAIMPHERFAGTRLMAVLLRLGRNADAETFEGAFLTTPAMGEIDPVLGYGGIIDPVVGYGGSTDPVLSIDVRVNSLFADAFDQLKRAIR